MSTGPETFSDSLAPRSDLSWFFEWSPDLCCLWEDQRFRELNPQWERLLGHAEEALLQKPILDFIHPDDREAARECFATVRQGGEVMDFECRFQAADGTYHWLSWRCPANQPNAPLYLAVARDVTRRRHLENALQLVARGTASAHGDLVFLDLVRCLAEALGVRHAFVGTSDPEKPEEVQVIAYWVDGRPGVPFTYRLEHTPCENVIRGEACFYSSDLQERFPRDPMLQKLGLQGYLGIPLRESHGKVLGLLVCAHDQPLIEESGFLHLSNLAASRAEGELERRNEETRRKKNEARYRAIVELSPDMICRLDLQGRLTFANEAFCRHLQLPRKDIIGRAFQDILKVSGFGDETSWMPDWKHTELPCMQEHTVGLPSGETRRHQWLFSSIIDEKDAFLELQAVGRDITESQRQERLLAETNQTADIGGWELDFLTNFLYWTPETYRIHEVSPASYTPTVESAIGFYAPESRDVIADAVEHGRTQGEPWDLELQLITASGRRIWVQANGRVECLNGKPIRAFGAFQDITKRKKSEQALSDREHQYRTLVNQVKEVLFQTDEQGRFCFLSPRWENLVRQPLQNCLNTPLSQWVSPEEKAYVEETFTAMLDGHRQSCRLTVTLQSDVPDPRTIEVQAATIHPTPGALPVIFGTLDDITERRQLEEQLRQSQKMDSIGKLAAGVAHDFNNILTIQQGYLSLLEEILPEDESFREPVREVMSASERAASLTRQLLVFSRKQVLRPSRIQLETITSGLIKLLNRLVGEHIALEIEHAADLPAIYADTSSIEQILLNLAVNSRDAMPKGGKFMLRSQCRQLTSEDCDEHPDRRPGEFVVLEVADTGTGIPEPCLPHIFEPFFTTKEVGQGTGLGLATVYGLVRQHEGWIEFNNRPGQGITFFLHFPAIQRREEEPASTPTQEMPRGHECVLLVEDESAVRSFAEIALRKLGYTVESASNGKDALELWNHMLIKPDLLLTDMVMPGGVSGLELARQLQKENPGIRMVLMSGYSEELAGDAMGDMKHLIFLPKPFSLETLAQTVRRSLDS